MLLRNGMKVAYQEFGSSKSPKKILALHGWLDNSNSFQSLGPQLAKNGYHVFAFDHIGHGLSSHLSSNSIYQMPNYVSAVKDVIGELGWPKTTIVGHSMGGAVGLLYAAAFRDIDKLVVIDNLGPNTFPASQATNVLRKYIDFQEKALMKKTRDPNATNSNSSITGSSKFSINPDGSQSIVSPSNNSSADSSSSSSSSSSSNSNKGVEGYMKGLQVTGGGGKIYNTINDAVNARLKTVTTLPGKQYLSREAAEFLVKRGVVAVDKQNDIAAFYSDVNNGPVQFRHDPRLSHPSHMYFTPEHVDNFIDNIACPVLLITGEDGWPVSSADEIEVRVKILTDKHLLTHHRLPGSHHLHLDPNNAPLVADKILDFLSK